jgi:hypothetical protein
VNRGSTNGRLTTKQQHLVVEPCAIKCRDQAIVHDPGIDAAQLRSESRASRNHRDSGHERDGARGRTSIVPDLSVLCGNIAVHRGARDGFRPAKTIPFELLPDTELMEAVCENEKDAQHLVGK